MQKQFLSGKAMIDKLVGDFEMLFEFKSTCAKFLDSSYSTNVELKVLAREMINMDLPATDQWKRVENYGGVTFMLVSNNNASLGFWIS